MRKILLLAALTFSFGCNDKPKDLVNKNVQLQTIIESPRHSDIYIYRYEDSTGTYIITTRSGPTISVTKAK